MSAFERQIGGSHYKTMPIQPMEFNIKNNIPFAEGSVIKYVSRWRSKGGVDDLKKARHVLDMLIELEEAKQETSSANSSASTSQHDHSGPGFNGA